MRLIDEIHLARPYWGSRNIRNELWAKGHRIGRGQVRRLMCKMGIMALYVKPRLSIPNISHRKYPYLLRGVVIDRPNQVWAADITYIPMAKGFCYLVAIMDWASRMVPAWRLSNTLDSVFCIDALQEAIDRYGCPEIFNTDQGCQFTAEAFTEVLRANNTLPSAWTAEAAGRITSLSNGSGEASNTKTSTSEPMETFQSSGPD